MFIYRTKKGNWTETGTKAVQIQSTPEVHFNTLWMHIICGAWHSGDSMAPCFSSSVPCVLFLANKLQKFISLQRFDTVTILTKDWNFFKFAVQHFGISLYMYMDIDMDMQHWHGHATWTWTCSMDMDMQGHGHAARIWSCTMDLDNGHAWMPVCL